MKLSLRLLLLLPFIFVVVGCPSDDPPATTEARPYSDVYNEDIAEIEDFMDTHFITVDGDYNVTFTKITVSTPGQAISSRSDLNFKTISKGGVDHKLYFLKLREGIGSNPTRLDSVFTSYKGYKTDLTSFDEASNPVWFQLQDVIQGWQEIFPEFKTGNAVTDNSTGITTYSDFGAGVMFVPSALAYFNGSAGSIGTYTPIIFNFKLMKLKYKDHDGDKILSKDEYGGPTSGTALDTDGDGKPDYGDFDDDNDGFLTKNEIKYSYMDGSVTKTTWYPYQGILVDNIATAIDETKGIPSCSGDFTSTNRVRKHLDASCH